MVSDLGFGYVVISVGRAILPIGSSILKQDCLDRKIYVVLIKKNCAQTREKHKNDGFITFLFQQSPSMCLFFSLYV